MIIAFTKTVSGRSPEKRGNGLKFVLKVVQEKGWKLEFYSGNGLFYVDRGSFKVEKSIMQIDGCLAIISY